MELQPYDSPHLLLGRFVEISGFEGQVRPRTESGEEDGSLEPLDPNGVVGRAVQWLEEGKYLVLSFGGLFFAMGEEHLVEHLVLPPEEGGFDFYLPDFTGDPEARDICAMTVGRCLAEKGFCVVQMPLTQTDRGAAVRQATAMSRWTVPDQEFESAYMGRENCTKHSMLRARAGTGGDPQEDVLAHCDEVLSQLMVSLEPACHALGFNPWGRMNSMVRVHASADEIASLRSQATGEANGPMERVSGHLNFLERRRLCTMLWMHNEGGEFVLYPRDEGAGTRPEVRIPLSAGKLIVFNNDACSYAYKPAGESMALQTWLLSEISEQRVLGTTVALPTPLVDKARATCLSSACLLPGATDDYSKYWSSLAGGNDTFTTVPYARWDHDMYYEEHAHDGHTTYTMHGAFVSDSSLIFFDNQRFGIDEEEAELVGPGQRVVLEVGYQALVAAGYDRRSLRGSSCGVFLGDSGNEWPYILADNAKPAPKDEAQPAKEAEAEGSGAPAKASTMPAFSSSMTGAAAAAGMKNCITGTRLHHVLGLVGPCNVVDTACSSGLVACNLLHATLRQSVGVAPGTCNVSSRCDTAMAMGMGLLLHPRLYCKYAAATMLSERGRSFSFDASADGYARGEGCGAVVVRMGQSEEDLQSSLACLIGSCTNQDGKSASMTAPNGPSQQDCIRRSMQQCQPGIGLNDIGIAECHGTGTALGDPIEFGAIRLTMESREVPIATCSAKASIGHLEACAGMAGVIKCMLMVQHCSGTPNEHLKKLNPNLDAAGFPAVFCTEMMSVERSDTVSGVSSFGFGGTNARADVWGRAVVGAKKVEYIDSGKLSAERDKRFSRVIEQWFDKQAISASPPEVHIAGSWDAFKTLEQMEPVGDGEYVAKVVMSDGAASEQFHIVLNQDLAGQVVHPAEHNADQRAQVAHPDGNPESMRWLIRGRRDNAKAGAVYEVRFKWTWSAEHGEQFRVSWSLSSREGGGGAAFRHQYSLRGTWTTGKFKAMVQSRADPKLWTTTVRIGLLGQEEFQLARDDDERQLIHPALPRAWKESVPVRGPRAEEAGRRWLIRAPPGEMATIQLRLSDGEITVTAQTPSLTQTWRSAPAEDWSDYHVAGSWNRWEGDSMLADAGADGVFRHRVRIGDDGFELFNILVDNDPERQLYPHVEMADQGEGLLCGPDGAGSELAWIIRGQPDEEYEIVLDVNEPDRYRAVRWELVAEQDEPLPIMPS